MTENRRGIVQLAAALAAIFLVLDQITKWVVEEAMANRFQPVEVTSFFNFVLTYNTGVSFGMLGGDAPWQPYALGGVALAISAGLFVWLWRQPDKAFGISVGLIVGGALGNAVDRVIRPGVADFLDFHIGDWHWPAFNLADSAITVGVALILLDNLFLRREDGKRENG